MTKLKEWIKAAGVRALRTLIQAAASAAIVAIGTAQTIGEVDWSLVAGTAGLAAILSLLTSLTGLPELKKEEPVGSVIVSENPEEETVKLEIVDAAVLEKDGPVTMNVVHEK